MLCDPHIICSDVITMNVMYSSYVHTYTLHRIFNIRTYGGRVSVSNVYLQYSPTSCKLSQVGIDAVEGTPSCSQVNNYIQSHFCYNGECTHTTRASRRGSDRLTEEEPCGALSNPHNTHIKYITINNGDG